MFSIIQVDGYCKFKVFSTTRQCISPSCYNILYTPDMLEQGEIDVRLNSFKGCFHQLLQTRKNY